MSHLDSLLSLLRVVHVKLKNESSLTLAFLFVTPLVNYVTVDQLLQNTGRGWGP